MSVFSYHRTKLSLLSALKLIIFPLKADRINGLIYAETMSAMILGSPVYSPSRLFSREIVVFAQWENEDVIKHFLETNLIGKKLAKGWHIRLEFLRQWGTISGFQIPLVREDSQIENYPVVAVTIARMKYSEIPRFIRWGRPVEQLVRDHPGATLSLASVRYPNIISTFSIWKNQREMTDMVYGHSKIPKPHRHIDAMKERNRKEFHFEFTTLRFKPISETGGNFIPAKHEER